jgi:hypothetical protein
LGGNERWVDQFLAQHIIVTCYFMTFFMYLINPWITCGSIHDWGIKKECITEKGLQMTTLDFCLSYIIIIVMDYCMPIDKMIYF